MRPSGSEQTLELAPRARSSKPRRKSARRAIRMHSEADAAPARHRWSPERSKWTRTSRCATPTRTPARVLATPDGPAQRLLAQDHRPERVHRSLPSFPGMLSEPPGADPYAGGVGGGQGEPGLYPIRCGGGRNRPVGNAARAKRLPPTLPRPTLSHKSRFCLSPGMRRGRTACSRSTKSGQRIGPASVGATGGNQKLLMRD
jgi:hypothetical protein